MRLKPGEWYWCVYNGQLGFRQGIFRCQVMHRVRVDSLDARGGVVCDSGSPERWTLQKLAKLTVEPPEWLLTALRGHCCPICGGKRSKGHAPTCTHPRAVARRQVST